MRQNRGPVDTRATVREPQAQDITPLVVEPEQSTQVTTSAQHTTQSTLAVPAVEQQPVISGELSQPSTPLPSLIALDAQLYAANVCQKGMGLTCPQTWNVETGNG